MKNKVLKAFILGMLLAVMVFFAAACAPAKDDTLVDAGSNDWSASDVDEAALNPPGVMMRTEQASYPAGITGLKVLITNNTDEEISYGAPFILERKQDGKWLRADMEDMAWIMIAYLLPPGETNTDELGFDAFTDPLSAGEYRILKNIGEGLYSAEFSVM